MPSPISQPLARPTMRVCGVVLCFLAFAGCRVTSLPLWRLDPAASSEVYAVRCVKDVVYPSEGDARRCKLDLYLPVGKKDFPVVVLVHGGAWIVGDNRCCGLYASVGEFFASQGIGVVMPNYSLSPRFKHPRHVKDVARAVRWTRENIARYGGDADRLFLAGHSAGGHLVSLLGTDESYLKDVGVGIDNIRGIISISGVYRIPESAMAVRLGGLHENSLRIEQTSPIRKEGPNKPATSWTAGLPIEVDIFAPVFGKDPAERKRASPVEHVRPGRPPFLIVTAENDLPTLNAMATEFHDALQKHGCQSTLIPVERRNHNSIVFLAIQKHDPVAAAMLDFISK